MSGSEVDAAGLTFQWTLMGESPTATHHKEQRLIWSARSRTERSGTGRWRTTGPI
ncbi:hypothetical protein [Synechococcus sp. KORDI-100]|uniref:hypothetical protein n=1 Tax=Synechococcus sp. KORDI-100 TaxID=1280380 RepID=UPI0012E0836F|nr:hypothetical protein [Synechococcus sp. KORDI-100]